MSPTGAPTETAAGETALPSAVGSATRSCSRLARSGSRGSRVLHFAGYKTIADR